MRQSVYFVVGQFLLLPPLPSQGPAPNLGVKACDVMAPRESYVWWPMMQLGGH